MKAGEKKIAKCYIVDDLDERNKCELSDRKLLVTRNGKTAEFAIEEVGSLSVHQRKLLIPLIFSGVLTPLILVGFFKGLFNPFIAVLLIISGIFTFYIGWLGEKTLTVNLSSGYRDFPIPLVTDHLIAFIELFNQYVKNEPPYKRVLYLRTDEKITSESNLTSYLSGSDKEREVFSYWQIRDMYLHSRIPHGISFILLDPVSSGMEVKYMKDINDNSLRPVVRGSIRPEAVYSILQTEELSSLFD